MEEKRKMEILGELYGSLNDRQKEQIRSLGSEAELAEFAAKEGIELPDELLDTVAGGGAQEELEFIQQLSLWDDVCRQRGIDVHDLRARDKVWHELFG